ncbi:CAP domain-containing protein [Deinococcus aerophilus]|nr:CAP domain-containing protein [Deinococcus aerophilus]
MLSVTQAQSAPTSAVADAMARSLSSAFAACGATPALNVPLSLAAADLLNGYELDAALKRQKFRPHDFSSFSMTYHGDVAWVKAQIRGQCGKMVGFKAFGLALDGTRLQVILATEARVDLSQSQRWMTAFLDATNRARFQGQKCGGKLMNAVPPLKWDPRLAGAAARHAGDMVQLNFRGHVNPTDSSTPQRRAAALGFVGAVGENIAYGPITAQEAVQELLTSPGHCENLMDPDWTLFGGSVNNGKPDTLFSTYWVQVFGMERR